MPKWSTSLSRMADDVKLRFLDPEEDCTFHRCFMWAHCTRCQSRACHKCNTVCCNPDQCCIYCDRCDSVMWCEKRQWYVCEKWDSNERHCCKACATCEQKYEWWDCTKCTRCHFQKCMSCHEVFCCSHSAMIPNQDWPQTMATCFQCWPAVRAAINETASLPLPVHDPDPDQAGSRCVIQELYQLILLPPELVHLILKQNRLSFCAHCQLWYQPGDRKCEDCDSVDTCPYCVKKCENDCCSYCYACSLRRLDFSGNYACANWESPCVINSRDCVRHSQDWCFQCEKWFCPVHHVEVEEFAEAMCVACWTQVQDRIDKEAANALLQ